MKRATSPGIAVGDLVVVVRSHCEGFASEAAGVTFIVEEMYNLPRPMCTHCGVRLSDCKAAGTKGEGGWQIPLQFLKRIPPLSELEGEKRGEEITA